MGKINWVLVRRNEWVRIRMSMEEKGGEVVRDMFSQYAAANVEIICSFHVFPIPDLGLPLAHTLLKSKDINISAKAPPPPLTPHVNISR